MVNCGVYKFNLIFQKNRLKLQSYGCASLKTNEEVEEP